MGWLLVPSMLAGGSEVVAHVTVLAFCLLGVFATVALALRLGLTRGAAMGAGLLLATTPAVLGMAGTVMPDVPAMALGVAGLERLVAWRDERRLGQGVAAAVLLGLAAMTRSHLFVLLAVAVLLVAGDYLRDRSWWTSRARATWLPIIAAPLLSVAVALVTRDPQGSSADLARAASVLSGAHFVPLNVVSFATHWVLAFPLALGWLLLHPRSMVRRWWVFLLATAAAAGLLAVGQDLWPRSVMIATAPIAGLGATVLLDVAADAWARRDSVQLTLAAWLFIALPAAIYVHFPAKYLVASAPAAALLVARNLNARALVPAVSLLLAAGAALGVAILRADAAFAGLGRRAASELIAPNVDAGRHVWFAGSWGFQWYAERAGGAIVSLDRPGPVAGDLLVTAENTAICAEVKQTLADLYGPRARHIASLAEKSPGGRLMDRDLGAGFFSNTWGSFPWCWGKTDMEVFNLWRIE